MSINIKPSHKGMLHKALSVPQDKKIPTKMLYEKKEGASPAMKKRIIFALNAKKFSHK